MPAICLAIVQNYVLARTPGPENGWLLHKRERMLDEEEAPSASEFEHLLTLKGCCEAFTEEYATRVERPGNQRRLL